MNWIPVPRTANNEERPEPIAMGMELVGKQKCVEVLQALSHLAFFDIEDPEGCDCCKEKAENCPPSKEVQSHDS
jgi:hypothetical protein